MKRNLRISRMKRTSCLNTDQFAGSGLMLAIAITVFGGCAVPQKQPPDTFGPVLARTIPENLSESQLAATSSIGDQPVVVRARRAVQPSRSPFRTVSFESGDEYFPESFGEYLVPEYLIEPGDTLSIKFRVTPDYNEEVVVRPDGMISLQHVGEVMVAGRTPEEVRFELIDRYSSTLQKPEIVVIVRQFAGNHVFVGGEVLLAGMVPIAGRMTVLQAIIRAGGFKDTGDKRRVVLIRQGQVCCELDLKQVVTCQSPGNDIPLQPYDVIFIPRTRIAKVNLFVEQYIEKVVPFQRSFGFFITQTPGVTSAAAP